MAKDSKDIKKYGKIKPFFDKSYKFNSIDIETYNNELFILGSINKGKYSYVTDNFYDNLHKLLIDSVRDKYDILTWSRYDNTHLFKLILDNNKIDNINKILERVGKVTPIFKYRYKSYDLTIVNIIKDSMIISIKDSYGNKERSVTIYNLKNLFENDLLSVAKDYKLDYYSKLDEEYHIINYDRFNNDIEYKNNVIYSNKLDNEVIIDIANKFLDNFKDITGVYPKSIFTSGSIARSFLMTYKDLNIKEMQFKTMFGANKYYNSLLDYSMKSYHGGKIESYVIGYIKKAKIIDITAAYPYALSILPKMTDRIIKTDDIRYLNKFFYAFIRCNVYIENREFIHPLIVKNPLNETNISPTGYLNNVIITKPEYDYLIKNNIEIEIIDYIGIVHENEYPYKKLVDYLFTSRDECKVTNPSKSALFKKIVNSLYGINYELTDLYIEKDNESIEWNGYRAGDFFNPILASYMTAMTRTYLSEVSYHIVETGGEVYLNMTDSIIYNGEITLDIFAEKKTLGKFDKVEEISDIMILGAGRYEYKKDLDNKYVIKSRGFSVKVKDKSFYSVMDFKDKVKIDHRTFVTIFKASTKKYNFSQMGYLIDDDYLIDPFNLGAKRIILNKNVNLNKEFTKTKSVHFDKDISEILENENKKTTLK